MSPPSTVFMKTNRPPARILGRQIHVLLLAFGWVISSAGAADAPNVLHSEPEQRCGAVLGGLGTGFLELWPDGCIHDWSIFNRGAWGYRQDFFGVSPQDRPALAEMDAGALQFIVRTAAPGGKPVVRRLSVNGEQAVPDQYTNWLQCVEGIDYDSTYPGAELKYRDRDLPVQVVGNFYSPMIPHETQISGTPGTYMVFTIRNTSKEEQEVSLAAYLRNPLARGGDPANRGAAARKLENTVQATGDSVSLTMRTQSDMPFKSTLGSMCLSMSGGEPSWIASDFGAFLNNGAVLVLGDWRHRFETPMRDFRKTGKLPSNEAQPCPTQLGPLAVGGMARANLLAQPLAVVKPEAEELASLTDEEVVGIIAQARRLPSLASVVAQAEAVDADFLDPSKKGRELVWLLRSAVQQYAGPDGAAADWGDGMLANRITLKPGEERQIRVVLSWYFPVHMSPSQDRDMGHAYTNWFKDAGEVNSYLVKNYEPFSKQVSTMRRIFQDSNLPPALVAACSGQLNTLVSNSWWQKDGKLALWEGLGCCGLNAATVYEQGSHLITALYPEMEKSWLEQAVVSRDPKTGMMFTVYASDPKTPAYHLEFSYVDRNCHFVWAACRDYLWFGNKEFLDTYYPVVVKSMGIFEGMDTDGDGLPDKNTNLANTYDVWPLRGVSAYFSSLWIGALRSAIHLADAAGDARNATKWRGILANALASFETKLWNGKYYSLWLDGEKRDEACMADQLAGEIYTQVMGLGNSVPPERAKQALSEIYRLNFTPDQGLLNAAYPEGAKPTMPTFQNMHADNIWTGTEFNLASLFISQGMVDEGLDVIEAVQRRYMRAGRFMSFIECGKRYNRPMAVWAAFLAATGFRIDVPKGVLTIAPPLQQAELKAPWISSTGLGQFTKSAKTFELACASGETSFSQLRVNVPGLQKADLNGKAAAYKVRTEEGLTVFEFAEPLTLKAGEKLTLR